MSADLPHPWKLSLDAGAHTSGHSTPLAAKPLACLEPSSSPSLTLVKVRTGCGGHDDDQHDDCDDHRDDEHCLDRHRLACFTLTGLV